MAEYHVGTKGASCEAWLEGKKQTSGEPLLWGALQMNRSLSPSGISSILGIRLVISVSSTGSQYQLPLPHTGLHDWALSYSFY